MSKKDYLVFAKMIREALEACPLGERTRGCLNKPLRDQLLSLAWDMTEIFNTDNPNFDEDRFMAACGFDYLPPPHEMSLAARWVV